MSKKQFFHLESFKNFVINISFAENNLNNSKQLLTTAEISKTNGHFPKFVVKNFPKNPTTS